jgi:transcriptional regulator with XRE-family HTH domain
MSREALAAAADGLSVATVRRAERGETRPHPITARALARVLGLDVSEILTPPYDDEGATNAPAGKVGNIDAQAEV